MSLQITRTLSTGYSDFTTDKICNPERWSYLADHRKPMWKFRAITYLSFGPVTDRIAGEV